MSEYTENQINSLIANHIQSIAILCAANPDIIVRLLTGYLWTEEQAGDIKRSDGKYDPMEVFNSSVAKLNCDSSQ